MPLQHLVPSPGLSCLQLLDRSDGWFRGVQLVSLLGTWWRKAISIAELRRGSWRERTETMKGSQLLESVIAGTL